LISGFARRPLFPIITVAAMKEGYRANLFASRTEAIAHALAEASGNKPRSGP
jgi:hypothetical protein